MKSIAFVFLLCAVCAHSGLVFQSEPSKDVPVSLQTPDIHRVLSEAQSDEPAVRMASKIAEPSFSFPHGPSSGHVYRISAPDRPIFETFRNALVSMLTTAFRHVTPFSPPPPLDLSKYTIWEVLNWTLTHPPEHFHHHDRLPLYRLAWLANLSAPIQEILSDPDADLTLFAPDDHALKPPSKPRLKHPFGDGLPEHDLPDDTDHIFWEALEGLRPVARCPHQAAEFVDQDKDKNKKKILLHIVELVLRYHISPNQKSLKDLLDSDTVSTDLRIAHDDSAPAFRIRVGTPPRLAKPGEVTLNFYTRIGGHGDRPIITKNGVIYIAHGVPLLPPFSPLSQLFIYPRPFSTLTSAIQKVHIDHLLLPHWPNKTFDEFELDQVDERVQSVLSALTSEKQGDLNKRSFTVFAPTNRAFRKLGPYFNAFLFSPFGAHVLRYVLSYHIVPDIIWYTDHVDNTTLESIVTRHETEIDFSEELSHFPSPDHPWGQRPGSGRIYPYVPGLHPHGKVNVTEVTLPTLLGSGQNQTLKLALVEFKKHGRGPVGRRVYVKQGSRGKCDGAPKRHHIPVIIPNGVAWGGALHVIPSLIFPPIPEAHKGRKDVQRLLKLLAAAPVELGY